MQLTPALEEKVMKAIEAAIRDVKPRPAIDRLLAARVKGKHAHYCQFLNDYKPGEFGVIDACNLAAVSARNYYNFTTVARFNCCDAWRKFSGTT